MLRPRALLVTCLGFMAFATSAAAQRAPITFAGQGSAANAAATETASLGAVGLSGGDPNSYGYGGSQRRSRGAVIDLRRPDARRAQPVIIQQPAIDAETEEADPAEAPAPVHTQQEPIGPVQSAPVSEQGAQPWLERERVGPPYEASGRWYVPTPEPGYEQTGTASWYGQQFHGRPTASGEPFDQNALTAAHPTLPIPSLVQVTNLENGREVIVRVNDRGPFVGNRLIDLSLGAAQALDFEQNGHARVHVRYLGPAPRRVNADGTPAPASTQVPAAPSPAVTEEGPRSLLPPPVDNVELADAPVEAAPPPPVGGYFVQVGAYSDPANAQRVRAEIAAAGPVTIDVRSTPSGVELFRVRLGPWASREEADAARRTLSSLGYADTVVAAR
ncbi:MAG: septal ring lytic transglycosylase RlpA family protein [Hyphomonadaceae bacterium]